MTEENKELLIAILTSQVAVKSKEIASLPSGSSNDSIFELRKSWEAGIKELRYQIDQLNKMITQ